MALVLISVNRIRLILKINKTLLFPTIQSGLRKFQSYDYPYEAEGNSKGLKSIFAAFNPDYELRKFL